MNTSQEKTTDVKREESISQLVHAVNGRMQSVLGHAEFIDEDLPEEHPSRQDVSEIISSCEEVIDMIREIQRMLKENNE